jgi:hypothetical protein
LLGGTLKPSSPVAKSMHYSFRRARRAIFGGNLLDFPVAYNSCVCLSANVLITNAL